MHSLIVKLCVVCAVVASPTLALCGGTAALSWNPSPGPTVAGYYLCWGVSSGFYSDTNTYPSTQTNGAISNLVDGQSYFFAVQAFASDGAVSPFSAQASLTLGLHPTKTPPSINPSPPASMTNSGPNEAGEDGAVAAPLVVQSPKQSGNLVTFTWKTAGNQMYQIQYTTNLAQNAWVDLGDPIVATNSTITISATTSNSQMFYRTCLLSPKRDVLPVSSELIGQ